MSPSKKVKRPKRKRQEKRLAAPSDHPAGEAPVLEPVRPKNPEHEGHLQRRAEWFRKRSGSRN